MRKKLIKAAAIALIAVVSVGLLEGLCTVWAWWNYGTVSVAELNALDDTSGDGSGDAGGDRILEKWYPHPYLGHVARESRHQKPNNIGLLGPDMPLQRDSNRFTILVTGGSVALWLCQSGDGKTCYLESFLNEYDFGRPVVILTGACGAWKQPQQTTMLTLYGDRIDAVVTLDGFNEFNAMRHRLTLGAPGKLAFNTLNPVGDGSYARVGAAWQSEQLRRLSGEHNCRALFLLTKLVRRRIAASVDDTPSQSIESMFALPQSWTKEEWVEYNFAQYQKYVHLMHVMSRELGVKEAHFIQPVPAIAKTLTADEKMAVGDIGYADDYRQMTDEMVSLNSEGIPVVSLLDVFEGVTQRIYVDPIHCLNDSSAVREVGDLRQCVGYRIMSERIATELARVWQLQRKSK